MKGAVEVLPDNVFYKPTKEALDLLVDRLRGSGSVVDIGCGCGDLCAALQHRGVKIVGVDLHMRESFAFPVLHMDARDFPFTKHVRIIIARPNRGDWYVDVIEEAKRKGVKELIYIGIEKHIEEDVDMLCEELGLESELLMEYAGEADEKIWSITLGVPWKRRSIT